MFHLAVWGNWWLRVMADPTVTQSGQISLRNPPQRSLSAEILTIQKFDPLLILSWFRSNEKNTSLKAKYMNLLFPRLI